MPRKVRLKSNFAAIDSARNGLSEGIRGLRDMHGRPLAEILKHIAETEEKLKKINLSEIKTAAEPISERAYAEIFARQDVQIFPKPLRDVDTLLNWDLPLGTGEKFR